MKALKEGLKSHVLAIKSGFITVFHTNHLIDVYSKHGRFEAAHMLFDEMSQRNVYTWNAIINACIRSQDLSKAVSLFDLCPCKDTVTYNLLISAYARFSGEENEAIKLFTKMRRDKCAALADEFSVTTMLNLIAKLKVLDYGSQLHSLMVKSGNDLSTFSLSSLIDMYSKCGKFENSCKVFKGGRLVEPVVKNSMLAAYCREGELEMAYVLLMNNPELNDSVSWNTIISGCVQNGFDNAAIELFQCMYWKGFQWNEHTFASLLGACSTLKRLNTGREVHALVLKQGMLLNPFISSGIVDIYCKCGKLKYAKAVHETFGIGNLFSTTTMIVAYCTEGNLIEARSLFDSSPEKNHVMWSAIIAGYVNLRNCEDAFALFRRFTAEKITIPDVPIFISMLGACAIQAIMVHGKQIHGYILRIRIQLDEKAFCALVDMYSKCGNILYAQRVFRGIRFRDSVIYNVMIACFAHHGYEHEAVNLFKEMREQGLQPDAVTFIAILAACRHSGLVEDGENYYQLMMKDYNIPPEIHHYSCMVDLYVRSNQLRKALAFIERMNIEPDSVMWSTFLNACHGDGNLELARMAEDKLLEIEGDNGARYIQLAGAYASGGKWDEMGRVMKKMRGKEVKKFAGCSWLQVGSGVHIFTSGDRSHSRAEAIYYILGNLIHDIYDTDFINENHLDIR